MNFQDHVRVDDQTDMWREVYVDFNDGEGWGAFAERNKSLYVITRKP